MQDLLSSGARGVSGVLQVAEFGISETKNMQKSSFIDEVFNIAPEVHRAGNMSSQVCDVYLGC